MISLICGGTGFIGRTIVRKLAENQAPIRVLARNPVKAKKLFGNLSVEIVPGDIFQTESLHRAMRGVSTVIHCAQFPGHPVENRRKGWTYWEVDASGTEAAVRAAKQAGVKHFIYFSGAGVNRGIDKPWFRAKEYAEISILKSGIPATILRPSWIYGHGDRSMSQFIKMLRWLPLFPMLGDGKNHVQPVHVEDVAELVTMILEKKTTGVFDIGGPKEMTMNELVQTLCRTLDKHRPIIHIPKWLAKLGVFPLQIFPQPPMTPDAIDFITMDIQIDTSPIKQAYPNWKPRAFTDKNATKSIFCR